MKPTSVTQGHAAGQAARIPPQTQTPATREETARQSETTAGFGSAVEIELSEAGARSAGPGKSAASPAHQARAFLAERAARAEGEEGQRVPFGRIVSLIARGLDPAGAFAAPEGGEGAETGDPAAAPTDEAEAISGDTAEETAADGTTLAPEINSAAALTADLLEELIEGEGEETL